MKIIVFSKTMQPRKSYYTFFSYAELKLNYKYIYMSFYVYTCISVYIHVFICARMYLYILVCHNVTKLERKQ